MKKPASKVKRVLRELQLIASVGGALLILYAIVGSALAIRLVDWAGTSTTHGLLAMLAVNGTMLVLAPLVCFGVRLVIEIHPWRLGLGCIAVVQVALAALRYETGGYSTDQLPWVSLSLELAIALAAGVAASLAARNAEGRVAAREAAEPRPTPIGSTADVAAVGALPPADDLAEQMRRVQEQARAQASGTAPASTSEPAAETPAPVAATGTDKP